MNPRILLFHLYRLIVLYILVLKDTLIIWKCSFKIRLYYPIKKLLRAIGFMLTLRIKEKMPLRMGWYLAKLIIKKVDANEL